MVPCMFSPSNILVLLINNFQGLMARRCFPVAKIASSNLVGIVLIIIFMYIFVLTSIQELLILCKPSKETHG